MSWSEFLARCKRMPHSPGFWFNGAIGVLCIVVPYLRDNFPQLQGYIPTQYYNPIMTALIVGNMMTHFLKLELEEKSGDKK